MENNGQDSTEKVYFDQLITKYEKNICSINLSPQNQLSIEYYNRRKLEIEGLKLKV